MLRANCKQKYTQSIRAFSVAFIRLSIKKVFFLKQDINENIDISRNGRLLFPASTIMSVARCEIEPIKLKDWHKKCRETELPSFGNLSHATFTGVSPDIPLTLNPIGITCNVDGGVKWKKHQCFHPEYLKRWFQNRNVISEDRILKEGKVFRGDDRIHPFDLPAGTKLELPNEFERDLRKFEEKLKAGHNKVSKGPGGFHIESDMMPEWNFANRVLNNID